MILPDPKYAIHKAWLYRVLTEISDNQILVNSLRFKGGTCAAMQGYLDRFSIDLDFDFVGSKKSLPETRKALEKIFIELGMEIKDSSKEVPQYFLRYPTKDEKQRNTLKVDITMPPPKSNNYETVRLCDIDRVIKCQTIETMFANKLVALIERFEKGNAIAGRDLYDIHHFFINGFQYRGEVIIERRKSKELAKFFDQLIQFVDKEITEKVINQDINMLLPSKSFHRIRKVLKQETLMFLRDELKRLES
ncbi:nucleotidyl transferase AbiEii/AbiGii toxin family protein [Patescibacteria group bacterium]